MREPRTYTLRFQKDTQFITLDSDGITPCEARRKAFDDLEATLKAFPPAERQGWRLIWQYPKEFAEAFVQEIERAYGEPPTE